MGKEGNLNDFLLILQMKQGNEKAFDKFVRKYYAEILSYCRYHCLDQAEAEKFAKLVMKLIKREKEVKTMLNYQS